MSRWLGDKSWNEWASKLPITEQVEFYRNLCIKLSQGKTRRLAEVSEFHRIETDRLRRERDALIDQQLSLQPSPWFYIKLAFKAWFYTRKGRIHE